MSSTLTLTGFMTGEDRFISRFLRLLPATKLVVIAIMELLTEPAHSDSIHTTRAVIQVGKAIEMEHHFQMAKKEDLPIPNFQQHQVPYYSADAYLELHKRRMAAKLENEGQENWMPEWTQAIRARVGAAVLDCLMRIAKITRTQTGPNGIDMCVAFSPLTFPIPDIDKCD
jgi:DNA-directed RNA polymerase